MTDKKDIPDGQCDVPLSELLNDSFVSHHSSFSSLDELMEASEFKIESQEDFEAIPDNEWDEFIKRNTSFNSWIDMLNDACEQWIKNR